MQSLPNLTKDGEDAWLRLKHHLEWCDYFALFFIFSAHPQVIHVFRERLADIYRARVTRLRRRIPEEPEQLLTRTLPELLYPPEHIKALQAPYWLDLSAETGEAWRQARLNFLLRLNERREILRHALVRSLILVLPSAELPKIREMVPDLWSIRHFSLTTGPWIVPAGEPVDTIAAPPLKTSVPVSDRYSEYEQAIIDEWERVKEKPSTDRGILLAGFRAYQVYSAHKRYKVAKEIADRLLRLSQGRIEEFGKTPQSLRDLSVSLDNVSDTARALGEQDEARRGYEESLAISRKIIEEFGETPESLRDLSVSLNNVSDTARALGELDEARRGYEESLAISRKIIEEFGETPESLRDLSVSLDRLGDTARALGELDEARRGYEESLAIRRKIIEEFGETPESLRDLAISLNNVRKLRPNWFSRTWQEIKCLFRRRK